jgi:hypothetical protein
MWLGPIQDTEFAGRVLKSIEGQQKDYGTWTRMHGMLTMAHEVSPSRKMGEIRANEGRNYRIRSTSHATRSTASYIPRLVPLPEQCEYPSNRLYVSY